MHRCQVLTLKTTCVLNPPGTPKVRDDNSHHSTQRAAVPLQAITYLIKHTLSRLRRGNHALPSHVNGQLVRRLLPMVCAVKLGLY